MNYKNVRTSEVIGVSDYNKLSTTQRYLWLATKDAVTHYLDFNKTGGYVAKLM
jgi:hypothetical protein